jgi:hypothetical protein
VAGPEAAGLDAGVVGRLRFPVGAGGGVVGAGGRTRTGRRGGAGGAWPVLGSSTRKRIVGGTTRPVGGGMTGRGGAGAVGGAAATGCAACGSSAGSVASAAITGSGSGSGAATGSGTFTGSAARGGAGSGSAAGGAGGGTTGSAAAAGGTSASGAGAGGAAGFADFTNRGGGSVGTAGLAGSGALPAGLRPFAATGVSAKDALVGKAILRWRARRSTNWRATTSSIVLEALFTSIP